MARQVKFEVQVKDLATGQLQTMRLEAKNAMEAFKQLAKGASESSRRMSAAASAVAFSALQDGITTLQGALDGIVAPVRSFETAMASVNTMAGKNAEGLSNLTESVKGLSKEIPLAREALANGLYQVISNGVPENNWITYLEQSAKASVGGIADLGQVVTVTSTLIKNYGRDWADAQIIQDMIQTTAKNGVTSFEQLAAALPRVSGTASQLGVTMEELMAVFATTTGVTGNTAEVSTQLAAVFKALVKPSKQAEKAAAEMGISFNAASVQAAGGFQNFLAQLDQTVNAYATKTGQLSQSIYANLFGSAEALRVLGSLTGEQRETFVNNIGAMAGAAGTIDEAFESMSTTAEANSQKWRNNMQAMMDWVGSVASSIQPTLSFTASIGATMATMGKLSASLKVVIPFISALSARQLAASAATKVWTAAQWAFNVAMKASPVGLIAAGLAVLAGGLIQCYNRSETFRNAVNTLFDYIKRGVATVVDFGKKLWDKIGVVFQKVAGAVKQAWEWIKDFFTILGQDTPEPTAKSVDNLATSTENAGAAAQSAAGSFAILDDELDDTATHATTLKAKLDAIGNTESFKTLDQFTQRLDYLNDKMKTAGSEEYAELKKQADGVEFLMNVFKGDEKGWKWSLAGPIVQDFKKITSEAPKVKSALDGMKPPKDLKPLDVKLNTAPAKAGAEDILKSVGNVMSNLNGILGKGASQWLNYASSVIQSVAQMLPAIKAMTVANAANSAAQAPIVGWLAVGAAVAGTLAAMASIPKFATGGIAYGPTLGVFGEYSGASTNPEVVAPLSKLTDLIQPASAAALPDGYTIRIPGRDLEIVFNRQAKYKSHI